MKHVLAVIPARYESSRFPGKVLHPVGGKPLIQWVVERVRLAKRITEIVVATDSEKVMNFCMAQGINCMMTREDHQSGTDRVAEVATARGADAVINIQGDEPVIDPQLVDLLAERLVEASDWDMVTAATPILDLRELNDPSVVKVVLNKAGGALYFSRATIPHFRDLEADAILAEGLHYRHLGIYGYRRSFLDQFIAAPSAQIEAAEKLEQLRALYLGGKIHVTITDARGPGVDHPEDVAVAEAALREAGLL